MVSQENIETASTATSIIPASTGNSDYNSTVIIDQNNQPEPISSELINLDISNILKKAKNLANNKETAITPHTAHKVFIDMIMEEANQLQKEKGQPEGLQQCIGTQRLPDPCRSVEKLHKFLPKGEKIPGPSQHLKFTEWMASIDGKEINGAFSSRMEEKQPSTTQASAKNSPSSQQKQFQREKEATTSEKGQRHGTSHKTLHPGIQNPRDSAGCHGKFISDGQNNNGISVKGGSHIERSEMISDILDSILNLYTSINDVKSNISDKNSSICNNLKTNNFSVSQMNGTLMCFEKVLRAIKTSTNDNSFGNKLNEQSAVIK
ncbi:hypothetical protein O181_052705 [Austropuccinia psidii MF-1]|uniref:Uncharacterized protein n=1 Tax=Austropuccinia psidii MF-1 TaxID=1389203 RepID=A0A9Q3E5G1_9BASI|nr:hypothetical protein [Austropuccinia psidii MF-1]